jgi:hypothetical protein
MNEQNSESSNGQAEIFQKIWMETVSKMTQAAFTFTPNSPPPEILRQIRSGIFQALAESWSQFLRSPQFLEAMKQWMEQAVTFRRMSNDFLGKVRHEMQSPSRDDIDTVMLAVRHMEKRVLDRLEELSAELAEMKQPPPTSPAKGQKPAPKIPRRQTKAGTGSPK